MTIDDKDMINSILESVSRIDYIKPEDIPNIDLYMDQVTTFMEEQLVSSKRYADDKILTKTMINNYAKNKLLPPPEKKRYSKEHVLMLIFIYYFKNILSINDTGLRHLREIKITINRRNAGFFMSNFIYFYVVRSCILSLYVI